VRNLTEGRILDESWIQWSPDGDRMLVFTAPGDWASPAKSKLYLLSSADGELSEIVIDEWQTSLPFWSPDGSQIAYVTGGDTINIWSDEGLQWLQLGSEVSSFVSWSPDGRYLIVPPVDDSHAAFIVSVAEGFGTITTFELDFDNMRSGNGPPIWGGITPLSAAEPAKPDA
jgi:Tol biopolymer transport system component